MTDAALQPTPNDCSLPRIRAQFDTFNEAIDYAAKSEKGLNFHDMRGQLERVYPYSELREDRIALIAETGPEFAAMFCACVYVGAWPVPLPLPTSFGGKDSFIDQLAVQLNSSDPKLLLFPEEIAEMLLRRSKAAQAKAMKPSPHAKRQSATCPRLSPPTFAICNILPVQPASQPASP